MSGFLSVKPGLTAVSKCGVFGTKGEKAAVNKAVVLNLTLALSFDISSASLLFFLALEERGAAFPSILSACFVFLLVSSRSLALRLPAFLFSTACSLGRGNLSFMPAKSAKAVAGGTDSHLRACRCQPQMLEWPQNFGQWEWR